MNKLNLEAGLAAVDNADSLDSAQKDATKRILRAFAGAEPETYAIGDKFMHSRFGPHMLVQVDYGIVALIGTNSANRLSTGVAVDRVMEIIPAEFERMCDSSGSSPLTRIEAKDD